MFRCLHLIVSEFNLNNDFHTEVYTTQNLKSSENLRYFLNEDPNKERTARSLCAVLPLATADRLDWGIGSLGDAAAVVGRQGAVGIAIRSGKSGVRIAPHLLPHDTLKRLVIALFHTLDSDILRHFRFSIVG